MATTAPHIVDRMTDSVSEYREAARVVTDDPDTVPRVATTLLDIYDRTLQPDKPAYVDLDNPASTLFKHVYADIPGYRNAFAFKPSEWPASSWVDEIHREFTDKTSDSISDPAHTVKSMFGRPKGWTGLMFTQTTAPVFHYAAETVGNRYVPEVETEQNWIINPLKESRDSLRERIVSEIHDQTTDILQAVYGDTVPVFRGLSPSDENPSATTPTRISDRFEETYTNESSFLHRHRLAESWTLDPGYAARYAKGRSPTAESGVLLRREIPTERILASSSTVHALNQYEAEAIVMHPPETTYTAEHIHPASTLTNQSVTELALQAVTDVTADLQ